jgi:hypothetical protein
MRATQKKKRPRNATARHVLVDLIEWRRLAVTEIERLTREINWAQRDLDETDRLIAAVRAA